jgi:hypothetical protein
MEVESRTIDTRYPITVSTRYRGPVERREEAVSSDAAEVRRR